MILQLGDDGDQVLEAEDETTVLTFVHHAVFSIVPTGGVSKVDHAHVHRWAAALSWAVGGATAAAAIAASSGVATCRGGTRESKSPLFFLLLLFIRWLILIPIFPASVPGSTGSSGGISIVDDEQGAGVEAVGLARLQGSLHLPESSQHRGQQLAAQATTIVEKLVEGFFEAGEGQFPAVVLIHEHQLAHVRLVHLQVTQRNHECAFTWKHQQCTFVRSSSLYLHATKTHSDRRRGALLTLANLIGFLLLRRVVSMLASSHFQV